MSGRSIWWPWFFSDSTSAARYTLPMSATATFVSNPTSTLNHDFIKRRSRNASNLYVIPSYRNYLRRSLSLAQIFHRYSYGSSKRLSPIKPFSPVVMEWQDCTVNMELDVPCSVAYKCYSDREAISRWMPFISSVKILEDKPELSQWSLKYEAFGQNIEFSWLARNLQPIPNQKIHWRSLDGLPNR